jgi:Protein of unknown function (DUF3631)
MRTSKHRPETISEAERSLGPLPSWFIPPKGSLAEAEFARTVDVGALLGLVEAFVRRHVILNEHQAAAIVLWVFHCWAVAAARTTPYIHVTSPEPESGKSRLIETVEPILPTPLRTSSMTPAVLFRAIQQLTPTLLFDEIDNTFRDKNEKTELLGLLNDGYRRGGYALRMGGPNRDRLDKFPTFSPKLLAGLDELPRALATRVIRVELTRKRPDEHVADFYPDEVAAETFELRGMLETWTNVSVETLGAMRPAKVPGLRDRLQDCWSPLFAIADRAGGEWPERARTAALHLSAAGQEPTESLRVRLLSDIRDRFGEDGRLWTKDLIAQLIDDAEAPWGDLRGKPLSDRSLGRFLKPFHIRSKPIRIGDEVARGFERTQFEDAWTRYLPAPDPDNPSPDVTTLQPASVKGELANPERYTDGFVTDAKSGDPAWSERCNGVTARKAQDGNGAVPEPGEAAFLDYLFAEYEAGHMGLDEVLERERQHQEAEAFEAAE